MSKITCHFELSSKKRIDGRREVLIRFTQNKVMRRVAVGIYVDDRWLKEKEDRQFGSWFKRNHDNLNDSIKDLIHKGENIPVDLRKQNIPITLDNVVGIFRGGEKSSSSFLTFAEKVMERLRTAKQVNTLKKYNTTINKLNEYLEELKKGDFSFDEFNVTFLSDYEAWMKSAKSHTNTIEKELKVLRAILYRAIKEDLFPQDKNPFFRFKLKSAKTKKAKLDEAEVKRIEELELEEGGALWHVRNYWLFSFYCYGVRFGDMATLKWTNIYKDRLQYSMDKTGNSTDLQMRSGALKIIEYYKHRKEDKNTNGYIFPILKDGFDYSDVFFLKAKISSSNAKLNNRLKDIAELAKIDKPLSFHIARHTFSDIARKKNVNLYTVSKALNHSSLKITENYLNSLDTDSVDQELRKALGE